MSNIFQLNEHILCSEVEDAFAVWFSVSRKFMMLEEPAFFVLEQIIKKKSIDTISLECADRYQNPLVKCQQFVSEVFQTTHPYFSLIENTTDNKSNHFSNLSLNPTFYSAKNYSIGNIHFKMNFGDPGLEEVIHPLISHFAVTKNEIPFRKLDIFRNSEKLFLKVDDDIVETLEADETGYLKAAVLLKFLEILYGTVKNDLMMTLHAAAVTDGNCAIVFPARTGSGKSTLAALLHVHGFLLVSDDFLAMDSIGKYVYHLPVAATIKEGSLEVLAPYYPYIMNIPAEKAYTGKQVRYLPINNSFTPNVRYLAKHFVFITYLQGSPCTFKEVPKKAALQSLLEETWINPIPSTVKNFFNWFDKTKFFEMKYSETSDAVEVVSKLFKQ